MLELTQFRNTIVALLHQHTDRPVIMMRQNADRPTKADKTGIDYPFLAYNFISTYIKDKGQGNYSAAEIPSDDPRFKVDLLESLELQPQFSISFTAYAKDEMQAKELAMKAWEFFRFSGYHLLAREKITVVEVLGISNRDIFEVDDYERREGFDVRFRRLQKIENRLETIEKYEIDKEVD